LREAGEYKLVVLGPAAVGYVGRAPPTLLLSYPFFLFFSPTDLHRKSAVVIQFVQRHFIHEYGTLSPCSQISLLSPLALLVYPRLPCSSVPLSLNTQNPCYRYPPSLASLSYLASLASLTSLALMLFSDPTIEDSYRKQCIINGYSVLVDCKYHENEGRKKNVLVIESADGIWERDRSVQVSKRSGIILSQHFSARHGRLRRIQCHARPIRMLAFPPSFLLRPISSNPRQMRTGEGFVLIFTLTSRQSFQEVPSFIEQILRVKDCAKIPLVLVG
jgi:hypothetical protein